MGMNKNFPAICAVMLICALLVVFFGSFAVKTQTTFSLANEQDQKLIYLTFDDGPSDRVTPKILDVLKEEDVKATFFIIGVNAESRRYLLEREVAEGHKLGVHTYSHKYGEIYASPESLIRDIERCNQVIAQTTGKPSTLYRFPGGSYGLPSALINAVTAHGMRYYDWNASTRDAELYGATPDQLYRAATAMPAATDKIVLLAHDSTTKSATAQALKSIIRFYKNLGYAFATLPD